MKKAYEKPMILFENFSLSTNIAGDCESIVGEHARGICGITVSSGDVIFSGNAVCNSTPGGFYGNEEEDIWDGFCYHHFDDEHELFNS